MIRALFLGGVCALMSAAGLRAQTAAELLARAERRVERIDSANRHYSGSFVQQVTSFSQFGSDTVQSRDSFRIVVREGFQQSRTPLVATATPQGVRMPPNTGTVLSLRNVVFPFRAPRNTANVDLEVRRLADTALSGRSCAVIGFSYHLRHDSTAARGAGRIWMALDDDTPVQSSYDLGGRHPRRGDFLSSITVQTATVAGTTVIARNATSINFSMQGEDVGHEHAEVVNTRFLSE